MKAASFYGPGVIHIEERETPQIGPDEILMKVHAAAVCGTDLRIFKFGHFKIPQGIKRVLGHEVSGEVAAVGEQVSGYAVGERISVIPNIGCGHCEACRQGYNQLCPEYDAFGINLDGGFQEYMKIPASAIRGGNIVKVASHISYEEATLVEPFSCTFNSCKRLGTKPGDIVLIIGAGPIGACHVMVNRLVGASKIIVADIVDQRLEAIQKFNADSVVNSTKEDLKSVVMRETGGRGADVIIAACSVPALQQQALELAAFHGRINFFGGLPKGKNVVPLDTNLIHYKELIVLGTTGASISDYLTAMDIVENRRVDLTGLVSKKFSLDETAEAFAYAQSGQGMKALMVSE